MVDCRVAVTGLNATDELAPGLAVLRSLRDSAEWHGPITGLAYDALDTGIYAEHLLDEVFLIPYPADGPGTLLERLKAIHHRTPLDVLIPTLDAELDNFCILEPELRQMGIRTLLPSRTQLRMRSKVTLDDFCRSHHFPVPKRVVINDPSQVPSAVGQLGLPVVVKGIFYDAHPAATREEAVVYCNKIQSRWGFPIILEEFILGDEYDVVALGNREGQVAGAVAMRKLKVSEKGKAWAGVTVRDSRLLELAFTVLERLSWTGPLEVEFVRSSTRRQLYVIEINPRFPAWVYLASKAGQNLPLHAVQLALDQPVEPLTTYQPGVTFVRHAVDVVCPLDYLESLILRGELSFGRKGLQGDTAARVAVKGGATES